jgi:3-dehydroquinate synthase
MNLIKLQAKIGSQKYPIIIGNNVLNAIQDILKKDSKNLNQILIIVDKNVPKKLFRKLLNLLPKKKTIVYFFDANEKNKNQKSINKILSILLKKNFNRNDFLISLGGGITGDVSGFAASVYKRGLKFVNIPTTLLSQVDSSIGGKTGINTEYGKNLIGSFYQPCLVISDIAFLKSLPRREIICGYGEILKHALIADRKFFTFLNKNAFEILKLKSPLLEKTIYKSCFIKKRIVETDEKETSLRKILNFGHTFAHAYEATLNYSKKLNHGEAVILGVKTAVKFSLLNNVISNKEFSLIENHIDKLNLPNNIGKFFSNKNLNQILSFMKKDKKNKTKKINLVLLKKIGSPIYSLQFDEKTIHSFLKKELIN